MLLFEAHGEHFLGDASTAFPWLLMDSLVAGISRRRLFYIVRVAGLDRSMCYFVNKSDAEIDAVPEHPFLSFASSHGLNKFILKVINGELQLNK